MGKDRNSEQTSQEETLEEVFAQLDDLAEKLEDKETSLEDSFNLYKQGMELLKFCIRFWNIIHRISLWQ